MRGQANILLLIIPGLLILGLFIGFFAQSLGENGTEYKPKAYLAAECDDRLLQLSSEYGFEETVEELTIEGKNFSLVDFNGWWVTAFDGSTCRLIEDKDKITQVFQFSELRKSVSKFPASFFEETYKCPDIAYLKGSEDICKVTGTINDIADSPVTDIIINIPTEYPAGIDEKISKTSVERKLISGGKQVLSFVKSAEVSVTLHLVEDATCDIQEAPRKAIWYLADAGNLELRDIQDGDFKENSLERLAGLSEAIILLEPAKKVEKVELNSDDPFGILYEAGVTLFKAGADASVTISMVGHPECTEGKQIEKFQQFQDQILIDNYSEKSSAYFSDINKLRSDAQTAIENEQKTKNNSAPDLLTWIVLPSKSWWYGTQFSEAPSLAAGQFYLQSVKAANLKEPEYKTFWEELPLQDIVFSVFFWGIILAICGLFVYSRFNE